MEFHEKLQELRKQKHLTQEELAQSLYVSRTAISKWESGRGYPSIDSLKAISAFFHISIDDLLSGNEVLAIAETDRKQREGHIRALVFGTLDCSVSLFFFLPFFGQSNHGTVQEVSLFALSQIQPWLKGIYFALVVGMILMGICAFSFGKQLQEIWLKRTEHASLLCNALAVFLFLVTRQPYVGALSFLFLTIKVLMLFKQR